MRRSILKCFVQLNKTDVHVALPKERSARYPKGGDPYDFGSASVRNY